MVATKLEPPAWEINKQDRKSKAYNKRIGTCALPILRSPLHASFFTKA